MRKLFTSLLAAVCLAACTPPIGSDELAGLGSRTDAVSRALGSPIKVQTRMISETAEYQRLCDYFSGRRIALDDEPPSRGPTETARNMDRVADVMGRYAAALIEATEGSSVAELEAAAAGFKTRALDVIGGGDVASPLAELFENAALSVGESRRQARIREIMMDVQPSLFQLERRLVSDAPSVVAENRSFVAAWERAARCVLTRLRSDPTTAIPYYDRIREGRAEIFRAIVLAEKAPDVVEALSEAHFLIATQPPDVKFTGDVVRKIYSDIDDVLDAGGSNATQ